MTATLDLANRKRIETFKTVVADLKAGKQHSITRLTTIKSLCKDPQVAAAFTKYLASLAAETLNTRSRPSHLSKEQWQTFRCLAVEGMTALEGDLPRNELREVLIKVRNSQNVVKHISWNDFRTIECGELLQIEISGMSASGWRPIARGLPRGPSPCRKIRLGPLPDQKLFRRHRQTSGIVVGVA